MFTNVFFYFLALFTFLTLFYFWGNVFFIYQSINQSINQSIEFVESAPLV